MNIRKGFDRTTGNGESDLLTSIPRMRAMARLLCRDRREADDLALDALTGLIARRTDRLPRGSPGAWAFGQVGEQFRSEKWRSRRRARGRDPGAPREPDALRRALGALADEQREALILVVAAGLADREVAAIRGCGAATIRNRVSRAGRKLLAILARDPAGHAVAATGFAGETAPVQAKA